MHDNDTICALATAPGGAVAIIRLSGPQALPVAVAIWHGQRDLTTTAPRTLLTGNLVLPDGNMLDAECLAVYMPGPHSYTGEDVVELQAHGGSCALRLALEFLETHGARSAEPGEFTRRAFLNGRLDLTQAEAVCDLIQASSTQSLRLANRQLAGEFGKQLQDLRAKLEDILAECESHLDFPEEDLDWIPLEELHARLEQFQSRLREWLSTARAGEILRGGLNLAIAGPPNVGKSSLLNQILGRNRAIVSPVPGTTRDTIEADATIAGMPLKLIDTAGLHHGADDLEQEGIRRSQEVLAQADIILWVTDATTEPTPLPQEIPAATPVLALANKADLAALKPGDMRLPVCALTGQGLDKVYAALEKLVWDGKESRETDFAVSARHAALLREAEEHLQEADQALGLEQWELAAISLRLAIAVLGNVTGQTVEPDVLGKIFSRFCIGK